VPTNMWLLGVLCVTVCLTVVNTQAPGVPAYLQNTFFGGASRITVPKIPKSISEPAINAPAFIPFQSHGISQARGSAFLRQPTPLGSGALLLRQPVPTQSFQPFQSSFGPAVHQPLSSFTNLGQPATPVVQNQKAPVPIASAPASGPVPAPVPGPAPASAPRPAPASAPAPAPARLGKAIGSASSSKTLSQTGGGAIVNQLSASPGSENAQSSLQASLGKALDNASRSAQFSLPTSDAPAGLQTPTQALSLSSGPPTPTQALTRGSTPGVSSLPSRITPGLPQGSNSPPVFRSQTPSAPIQSLPGNTPFGPKSGSATFSGSQDAPQISNGQIENLQKSLGEALDQASSQFSRDQGPPTNPIGSPNSIAPSVRQGSGSGFPQRLNLTPQGSLQPSISSAIGQGSNIGPAVPAVPQDLPKTSSLLQEVNLGGSFPSNQNTFGPKSSGSNSVTLIRGSTNVLSNRAPSSARLSTSAQGNRPDIGTFRSDPKLSAEQNLRTSGRIFLGSTQQSGKTPESAASSPANIQETPRSSPPLSSSTSTKEKVCTKTFHEECHNEYDMVCEETFTEKEKYECNIVEETKCEKGHTVDYEPACFQQILDNCENICKRGIQPDCVPQCARSLGKTSCHKVKVVTPHTTCTKVPKEVCGNIKKQVPYEKCRDVPRKVCEQIPREVCT